MAPPIYPSPFVSPSKSRVYWGSENAGWGYAPGTLSTDTAVADLVENLSWTPQVNVVDVIARTGATSGIIDRNRTTRAAELTLTGPYRADGIFCRLLANLMGSSSAGFVGNSVEADGVYSGSKQYHSITPAWGHNREPTISIWEDLGSKTVGAVNPKLLGNYEDVQLFLASTVKSWQATFGENGLLQISAVADSLWPVTPDDAMRYVPLPTGAGMSWVGGGAGSGVYSDAITRSHDASYQLTDRSGVVYDTHILSGTLTVSRPSTLVFGRQARAYTALPQASPQTPTCVLAAGGSMPIGTYQYATAFAIVKAGVRINNGNAAGVTAPTEPNNMGGVGPLSAASAAVTTTSVDQTVTVTLSTVSPADALDVIPPHHTLVILLFRTLPGGTTFYFLDAAPGIGTAPLTYTDDHHVKLSVQVHAQSSGYFAKKNILADVIDTTSPIDIQTGDLAVELSLNVLFEGALAGLLDTGAAYTGTSSIYRDFLDFVETSGLSYPLMGGAPGFQPGANQQVIQWRDSSFNILRLTMYPIWFDAYVIDRTPTGGVVAQVTARATNSIADINAAVSGGSGGLTAVRNLFIVNDNVGSILY